MKAKEWIFIQVSTRVFRALEQLGKIKLVQMKCSLVSNRPSMVTFCAYTDVEIFGQIYNDFFVTASYPIVRGRGRFGNVSVLWILEPTYSGDITPVQGAVVFTEGEYMKNLTLFSKPDEVKIFHHPYSLTSDVYYNTRVQLPSQFRQNSDRSCPLPQALYISLYLYFSLCLNITNEQLKQYQPMTRKKAGIKQQ